MGSDIANDPDEIMVFSEDSLRDEQVQWKNLARLLLTAHIATNSNNLHEIRYFDHDSKRQSKFGGPFWRRSPHNSSSIGRVPRGKAMASASTQSKCQYLDIIPGLIHFNLTGIPILEKWGHLYVPPVQFAGGELKHSSAGRVDVHDRSPLIDNDHRVVPKWNINGRTFVDLQER